MTTTNAAGAAATPTPSARPRLRRISAVVNAAAGSVAPGAAEALSALVAEYGYDLTLSSPAPDEIETAVKAAVDAAPDLVVILAGDGTARLAAELSGPDGPLVAPLPGGTLNVLPHVLYGAVDWPAALTAAFDEGVERAVCGGRVGGHAFYVAAVLGAPALWAHAREAIRARHFLQAWRHANYALNRTFGGGLHYGLNGDRGGSVEALVLISPTVSRAMADDEGALEAAALDVHGAREAFRLAFTGLFGDWRRDPAVVVEPCRHGRAWARAGIPCILDGETHRLPRRVEFDFEPRAFRALAPPPKDSGA